MYYIVYWLIQIPDKENSPLLSVLTRVYCISCIHNLGLQCNRYKLVSINGEPLLARKWGIGDLNFQGVIIPTQNDLYKWGEIDKSKHNTYKLLLFNAYSTHSEKNM